MTIPTAFFQASWVVNDLQAAMRKWIETGRVGPFFVNKDVQVDNPRYRGQPTRFEHNLAIAQAGPLQIELIEQPNAIASVYRDSFAPGEEGFHHMGCFVEDVDAEFQRYTAQGVELAYEGMFGDVHFGYVDTRPQLGFMVEILEHKPGIDRLFQYIADAATGWDGSDPIRPFPLLD